ncbi:hypothetical protein EGW08_016694 [Elysia chlorotica]|uniref:Uncharacterized protein n=1 Tax=Elysia chlorotica TaxID=188477 RepID=A0A433T1R7_ELYCH|nr:hypothetical protein EGW08_016694 [Elysia chlorotica]
MTTGRINQIAFDKTTRDGGHVGDGRSSARAGGSRTPSRHFHRFSPETRRGDRGALRGGRAPASGGPADASFHMQARGSAQGERDRRETSGRETVQRTMC